MRKVLLLSVFFLSVLCCAQVPVDSVFTLLATPDGPGGAAVIVEQDASIVQRLGLRLNAGGIGVAGRGFRVQIFAGNNGQQARTEAFKIERVVMTKHPEMEIYVTYAAPFWKVRVGNCRTNQEAVVLRDLIMEEFPQYKTETYIVPDDIIIN